MSYKLLYIEDQDPGSIKTELESFGFVVDVDDASNLVATINSFNAGGYDAFLMDYRLTAGKGKFDAPAFAAYLRTEGRAVKSPVILITNENTLLIIKHDQSEQLLFDVVFTKEDFLKNIDRSCKKITSYIDFYKKVSESSYNLSEILAIPQDQLQRRLDFRLLAELEKKKTEGDIFGFTHILYNYLIRSVGALIGPDYLASRLGFSSEDLGKITKHLEACMYKGCLSDCYRRWWMDGILQFWEKLDTGENLRRITAEERTKLLNEKLDMELSTAVPGFQEESTVFWTICTATKKPLDPSEGFICNDRERRDWEEDEYVSMKGALEFPNILCFLSSNDKREILEYGNKMQEV